MPASVTDARPWLKFNLAARPRASHNSGLQTKVSGSVNEVRGARRFALRLLVLLLRLWSRTLRLEVEPAVRARLVGARGPVVFVLWHNRLFLVAELFRRLHFARPIHALVSASRDGAWLAAFFRLAGLVPVRGSTSRRGPEAGRELLAALRAGHDIGVTPDGPRGPAYSVAPGALVVAQRAGAPLVLLGIEFGHAWRLASWDRFYLPWPFSRVVVRCAVLPPGRADGTATAPADLRTALLALNPDRPD